MRNMKIIIMVITAIILFYKFLSVIRLLVYPLFLLKYIINNTIFTIDENIIIRGYGKYIDDLNFGSTDKLPFYLGCCDGLITKKWFDEIKFIRDKKLDIFYKERLEKGSRIMFDGLGDDKNMNYKIYSISIF